MSEHKKKIISTGQTTQKSKEPLSRYALAYVPVTTLASLWPHIIVHTVVLTAVLQFT
jgi:hypothetical protein